MKKSLIALAALAAVSAASAQSTITITGTVEPMFQNQKTETSAAGSRTTNTMETGTVGTSRVIFNGTEDLGGGLKAMFLYEMDFDATLTGSTTALAGPTIGGEIYVGAAGDFGSVKLGVPNTPSMTTQGARSGFTTKIGGGRSGFALSGASRTRQSDSIRYDTPTIAGFSAAAAYTAKVSAGTNAQGFATAAEINAISDIGAFYANGPISAGISNYSQSAVVNHTTAFASYTMGALKGTLGFHTQDNKLATTADTAAGTAGIKLAAGLGKSQGYNVALDYKLTPAMTLIGNVARTDDKTVLNRDLSLVAVGVKYDLSKRTSLHARYISEKRDNVTGASSAGVPTALKTTLVGLLHNF